MDIPVENVVFDDATRIREDLDETSLLELVESFKNVGQITPIVIERSGQLVAGRRRLEAARRLGWPVIRAEYRDSLTEIDRRIIEFDENDKRRQLSWQEAARAIKEIHALKRGEAKSTGNVWTAANTASILGLSEGKVSEDLVLADYLSNERVANRPSRRGALDTLKRERELVLVRELARRRAESLGLGVGPSATGLTGGVIYNADCRTILKDMAPDSVDLVIIDPPWGINFDTAAQWSRRWIASYDDREEQVQTMLLEVFKLLFKVLKPTCHIYCFYPIQESQWWVERLTEAGFMVRGRPLVWFKTGQPSITDTYTSFLPAYESILWGYKPGTDNVRRLFGRPVPEAQGWPREPTIWHENSKPLDMLGKWIESSSEVNEVVLDCFGGGGSTAASAFALGRYYISVELDEVNYKKSVERLKALEERKEESDSSSLGTS